MCRYFGFVVAFLTLVLEKYIVTYPSIHQSGLTDFFFLELN